MFSPHCRRRRCDQETIRSAAVTPDGSRERLRLRTGLEGSRFVPKSISSLAHIAVRAEISLAARPSTLADLARSVLRLAETSSHPARFRTAADLGVSKGVLRLPTLLRRRPSSQLMCRLSLGTFLSGRLDRGWAARMGPARSTVAVKLLLRTISLLGICTLLRVRLSL